MFGTSRRGLQSAGAARQGNRRPTADEVDPASLELPPYQEPRLALTKDQQTRLRELSTARPNASLQKHINMSAKLLGQSAYAINERATNRKQIFEGVRKKRRANTDDGDEADKDAGIEGHRAKAEEMKAAVDPLTLNVDKAMRDILDLQAGLEDEKEVLSHLPDIVARTQAEQDEEAQRNAPDDEDEQPPEVPGISIHRIIEQDREQKSAAYDELSNFQKYAKHQAYVEFRRQWHDGLYPNDEIPVPDPKTWFDSDGEPQYVGADGEDDSDDDIHISKEVRSTRCPLSLVEMSEPYTCKRCKHTFQKEAIVGYLQKGPQKCPQTGCDIQVRLSVTDIHCDYLSSRPSC